MHSMCSKSGDRGRHTRVFDEPLLKIHRQPPRNSPFVGIGFKKVTVVPYDFAERILQPLSRVLGVHRPYLLSRGHAGSAFYKT